MSAAEPIRLPDAIDDALDAYRARVVAITLEPHAGGSAEERHAVKEAVLAALRAERARAEQTETRLAAVREAARAWQVAAGDLTPLDLWVRFQGRPWQCSGCGHVCRSQRYPRACRSCGREGYYSGSVNSAKIREHDEAGFGAALATLDGAAVGLDRGTAINEAASRGAAAVKAREAAERMPLGPERRASVERALEAARDADEAWARVRAMAEASQK